MTWVKSIPFVLAFVLVSLNSSEPVVAADSGGFNNFKTEFCPRLWKAGTNPISTLSLKKPVKPFVEDFKESCMKTATIAELSENNEKNFTSCVEAVDHLKEEDVWKLYNAKTTDEQIAALGKVRDPWKVFCLEQRNTVQDLLVAYQFGASSSAPAAGKAEGKSKKGRAH